jgi:Eukaryotic protein of unknown function (DUF846)
MLMLPSILIFILTVILLAVDFYYLKNIAGRRLVGLRWWNEVNPQTGESHWVFESADAETRTINPTDRRFFWLALYAQPALWVVMGIVAIMKIITFISITPLWLTLVGKCCFGSLWSALMLILDLAIALALTITNTIAFSRCDKFSQASSIASRALNSGGLARSMATGIFSRFWGR